MESATKRQKIDCRLDWAQTEPISGAKKGLGLSDEERRVQALLITAIRRALR